MVSGRRAREVRSASDSQRDRGTVSRGIRLWLSQPEAQKGPRIECAPTQFEPQTDALKFIIGRTLDSEKRVGLVNPNRRAERARAAHAAGEAARGGVAAE